MIELNASQYNDVINAELTFFINEVKTEIIEQHYEMISNIDTLSERLVDAFNYIYGLGFSDKKAIRAFLYFTAFNLNFKDSKEIKNALEKPGRIPEQQFKDLLLIVKNITNRGER